MVTGMVKPIKLTGGRLPNFPDPSAELVLQTNDLFNNRPVLRFVFRAKSCRILPFSAKNVQIVAENERFSRSSFGKDVKSLGSCQSITGGLSCRFRQLGKRERMACERCWSRAEYHSGEAFRSERPFGRTGCANRAQSGVELKEDPTVFMKTKGLENRLPQGQDILMKDNNLIRDNALCL